MLVLDNTDNKPHAGPQSDVVILLGGVGIILQSGKLDYACSADLPCRQGADSLSSQGEMPIP